MGKRCVFAFVLVGCTGAPTPAEPMAEETFTMTTDPRATTKPIASREPSEASESSLGSPPWIGRLKDVTHSYSNGCVDHRRTDLLALVPSGDRPIPIIIGWRHDSPQSRVEPHFLKHDGELPPKTRGSACVMVIGAVVTYAHEGYSGSPARGIEATSIAPAPCPP